MEIKCPRCNRNAKFKVHDYNKQQERKRVILNFPCYHYADLIYNVPYTTDENVIIKDFKSISKEYFNKTYYLSHGKERYIKGDLMEENMNDRVLYNAKKEVLEEVKQELLKKADTERQRNIIKEVCNSIARKHKFDDM